MLGARRSSATWRHGRSRQRRVPVHQKNSSSTHPRHHPELAREAPHDLVQRIPRVGVMRRSVEVMDTGDVLRGGRVRPGHQGQASGAGHSSMSRSPSSKTSPSPARPGPSRRGRAPTSAGSGHPSRPAPARRAQHLAARHAAKVRPHQLHALDVRVQVEERLRLAVAVGSFSAMCSCSVRVFPTRPAPVFTTPMDLPRKSCLEARKSRRSTGHGPHRLRQWRISP